MHGSKKDFVILAAGLPDLKIDFDADIRHVPLISNKATHWRKYMSKVYLWSLTEYDQVFHIEADCFAIRNPETHGVFKAKRFIYTHGPYSPLNAARFILQPSEEIFQELHSLAIDYPFSKETGWEEYGDFSNRYWRNGEPSKWTFYAADDEQGLFFYYFILKKEMAANNKRLLNCISHSCRIKTPEKPTGWLEVVKRYKMEDEVKIIDEYYAT